MAEYITIEARNLAPLPDDVDFATAAALVMPGLTAWQGIFDHGKVRAGQRVLVHGAAGVVGSMAVQLGRIAGAYVIGTGRADGRQTALDYGAQEYVDLDNDEVEALEKVDVVFDIFGGDIAKRSAGIIRDGGTLVSIAGPVDSIPVGGRMIDFIVEANRQQLVELATLVQEGKIKTNVGNIAAFDQAVAAFAPNVRLKGKTIIHIRS